jgi:YidC/Oxa1 family membrane protein insertase
MLVNALVHVIANPLQPLIDVNDAILRFFHDTVGVGWGPAIIGLTCVIRLVILPLTFRQVRSMQALQRLQPEMKKIQERYKEDKQRMQQELMKFYQEHNFNPLSSCLPLLLQLPFFLSLFYLQQQDEFKQELRSTDPSFLFIDDLTRNVTGATLVVLLVIYLVTQLGSSYVSAVNISDPTQRRLLFLLPIFFSFIIINFPAGLIVYWITTNVWTIGQQLAIRKFLPAPEPIDLSKDKGKGKPAPAAAGGDGGGQRKGFWARAMAAAEQSQAAKGEKADGDGDSRPKAAARQGSSGKASGAKASGGKASSSAKPAKAGKAARSEGGNGGPSKPPPSSPRKKKKRSGRRR